MAPIEQDPKDVGRYWALSQVAFEIAVPIGLGMFLDSWLGWMPWATLGGMVLGLGGGLAHLMLFLKNDIKANTRRGPKP